MAASSKSNKSIPIISVLTNPSFIISVQMTEEFIKDILQGSKKGDLIGYSDLFTFEIIRYKAEQYGVTVNLLPKSNPLRKKYGEYVVRVTKPYTPKITKRIAYFAYIHSMEVKTSPGNRKCQGQDCIRTIPKGGTVLEVAILEKLFNKTVIKKKSYCKVCADNQINSVITQLLKLKGHSDTYIASLLKSLCRVD